jgi:hypothetical protein
VDRAACCPGRRSLTCGSWVVGYWPEPLRFTPEAKTYRLCWRTRMGEIVVGAVLPTSVTPQAERCLDLRENGRDWGGCCRSHLMPRASARRVTSPTGTRWRVSGSGPSRLRSWWRACHDRARFGEAAAGTKWTFAFAGTGFFDAVGMRAVQGRPLSNRSQGRCSATPIRSAVSSP